MLRDHIRTVVNWLRRAITQPFEELNRWQRAARYAYDLGRYGAHQLREDRASEMAAALAFRTLFGLAPVLVVATILVKSLKGADTILDSLHTFLVGAGLDRIQIVTAESGDGSALSLAKWLEDLASQMAGVNLSAIGWVGLAVIVYAAIGLMVTIENGFNIIYRSPTGRAWTRRVPLYWFILTLSPVLLLLGSYVNEHFNAWIAQVDTWQWLLVSARAAWSFSLAWLFMFAVYTLIPNSTVPLQPALVGAFVAAVLLGIGKHTLGAYLGNAFAINQLYGSLGLVPLFMFWVYLMWLAVLFGLQVSATLHMLHGRSLDKIERRATRTGIVDPAIVLTIMEIVAENFGNGKTTSTRSVAEAASIAEPNIVLLMERLVQEGMLLKVEHPETGYALAKPADNIDAATLVEVCYRIIDENSRQGRKSVLSDDLRSAQQKIAEGNPLSSLITS